MRAPKEKGPRQHPGALKHIFVKKLLDGVDQLLDARLALSSLVLVNDALGSSLVEELAGLVGGSLSDLDVLSLNGGTDSLDGGLQLRADSAVADASLLGGDDALLLRLDVSHVRFLSISNT